MPTLNCCICDLADSSHSPAGDSEPSSDGPGNRPGAPEADRLLYTLGWAVCAPGCHRLGLVSGWGWLEAPARAGEAAGLNLVSPWPGSVMDPQCDLVSVSHTVL